MLNYNLAPIFKARGITKPHAFLVKSGFTSHTAHNIANHQTRIFRLDHIEKLCKILICEPNDLLVWRPNSNEILPPNHPLHKLKTPENQSSLHETLFQLPYQQVKEITQTVLAQSQNNPNTNEH